MAEGGDGRVYAPHVVADLEGDGVVEIVYGNAHEVYAYEWVDGALRPKRGWPADTTTAGDSPEVRGLAAGDLDGERLPRDRRHHDPDAARERRRRAGVRVRRDGSSYQPPGLSAPAWPRYNARTGAGGDADRNGQGHDGYGCYGLNVGIGNIDDDPALEILATYDNHHIQAFDPTAWRSTRRPGSRIARASTPASASPGGSSSAGRPRRRGAALPPARGEWPHPSAQEWLQWTRSPPNVVDLDGDGRNEVLGIPNVELHVPYETQAYAVMVLEGAHGDGSRSAMRKAGWETLPRGGAPITVDGWYPPGASRRRPPSTSRATPGRRSSCR